MYITEGMNCYKVYWKDMSGNVNYFFCEGLTETEVKKDAHAHIQRMYMASYSILKIALHGSNSESRD